MTDKSPTTKPKTPPFLKPLDGYPGAFIESLDAIGPTARVTWVPDQRQTSVSWMNLPIRRCDPFKTNYASVNGLPI